METKRRRSKSRRVVRIVETFRISLLDLNHEHNSFCVLSVNHSSGVITAASIQRGKSDTDKLTDFMETSLIAMPAKLLILGPA